MSSNLNAVTASKTNLPNFLDTYLAVSSSFAQIKLLPFAKEPQYDGYIVAYRGSEIYINLRRLQSAKSRVNVLLKQLPLDKRLAAVPHKKGFVFV